MRGVAVASSPRAAVAASLVTCVLAGSSAFAEDRGAPSKAERFDHRGAIGLLVGPGLQFKESASPPDPRDGGFRALIDLGGTYAIGVDGNELLLAGRVGLGGPLESTLYGGYRGYFGLERVKTFFDLDLALHFTPKLVAGPRVGFGVQYELSPVVGVFAGAALQFGLGQAIRFDAELVSGLQLRTYVLE